MTQETREQHLRRLYRKFRDAGMCSICALGCAIAAIERQDGITFEWNDCSKWNEKSDCAAKLEALRQQRQQAQQQQQRAA